MNYLAEIDTAAGLLIVGPFDTLTAAKNYAETIRAQFRPLIPPTITAPQLHDVTRKELAKILDKL